ncbi:DUF1289 domain-containing protein [Celeribacter ethanolicus]|uniref:DUF1289 domain-containing protein n=1 Tax=Celeribacter ethanolicus TaxID=1758178 RepID=A0A291G925_9RHOB|nr:DUF1289 domain-containing protein [Celeribacter ethanolicus]ATG46657.1 DUF1289 domain-containing protein [Celeribacter ethanolicus]TNE66348.1 MAG: DUF1289 domain-containing protein [Paracoccaceae bacterium]
MTDDIWKRDEIESPCTKICQIHPDTRLCLGCARSIDEIGRWSSMSAEERRAIMAELPNRSPAPTKRRGGRAARLKRME